MKNQNQKENQSQETAVILGKIVNTILAIVGGMVCIYGIYYQLVHNFINK